MGDVCKNASLRASLRGCAYCRQGDMFFRWLYDVELADGMLFLSRSGHVEHDLDLEGASVFANDSEVIVKHEQMAWTLKFQTAGEARTWTSALESVIVSLTRRMSSASHDCNSPGVEMEFPSNSPKAKDLSGTLAEQNKLRIQIAEAETRELAAKSDAEKYRQEIFDLTQTLADKHQAEARELAARSDAEKYRQKLFDLSQTLAEKEMDQINAVHEAERAFEKQKEDLASELAELKKRSAATAREKEELWQQCGILKEELSQMQQHQIPTSISETQSQNILAPQVHTDVQSHQQDEANAREEARESQLVDERLPVADTDASRKKPKMGFVCKAFKALFGRTFMCFEMDDPPRSESVDQNAGPAMGA